MTVPPDDTTADTSAIVAALRTERDAALAREAALADELAAQVAEMATRAAELADRKTEFDERIEHQAATVDVLRVMSASPGNTQPVFDLIVRRAVELCNAQSGGLFVYDGERVHIGTIHGLYEHDGKLLHVQSLHGTEPDITPASLAAYLKQFPMPPKRGSISMRAILDCQIMHIRDMREEVDLLEDVQRLGHRSQVSVPLLREARAIGVITMAAHEPGGFSESQIALLKTFAEQAVIAITSAETYRALQTRTSDLQETLEYQTATSDVLKVISRSTFDLQPVLSMVAETAARLCVAEQAAIYRREGDKFHLAASIGFPPEFAARLKARGAFVLTSGSPGLISGAIAQRRAVHIHDVAAVPGYPEAAVRLGKQRTSLGVPLLREGEPVGVIVLARQRVEPFTERQIALVSTFADQAVIAIENTRLITEQREALEQQTAMAEVLQVINASPGNLAPVFEAILEKANRLCEADMGTFWTFDGERFFPGVTSRNHPLDHGGPAMPQGWRPSPSVSLGRVMAGEGMVHVVDVSVDDGYQSDAEARARTRASGTRSALTVALRAEHRLLGAITTARKVVRPYSDKQISLLKSFAAQAVIAMENARLITEQREALEQQTATAEVLQVINASPGNLAPVFNAILEKAHGLCGATHGSLHLFDGEKFRAVATYGISEVWAERTRDGLPAVNNPVTEPLLDGARLVHIADMVDINHPLARVAAEATGVRTALFVPLRKDNRLIGAISALRREVRPFTEKEIALLENFAAQAVIAMENARLLTETREALEQQTATADVLRVINGSPGNLVPVFNAILEWAHRVCDADGGVLYTYDGTHVRVTAVHGYPSDHAARMLTRAPYPPPNTVVQQMVATGRFIQVEDVQAARERLGASYAQDLAVSGMRTAAAIPLLKDGRLIGYITAWRRDVRLFSDKQIALLENFAAQAVIAMENARLLTETREALEQQTATAEVLQVINASPGNLAPVFDAILEKAARLCEAEMGTLWTYDGEYMQPAAMRGAPPSYAEFLKKGPHRPNWAQSRVLHGERVIHTVDVEGEGYRSGDQLTLAGADLGGIRTLLVVPLRKDEAALGTIGIYRQEVRPFTDKQIALLENFAAQAVIAMENARLLNEQGEALERQTATAEVLQVINASPGNLAPVFDAMLEKAHGLCGIAMGSLELYDGQRFRAVSVRGLSDALADMLRQGYPASENPATRPLIDGGRLTHIRDVRETDYAITRSGAELDAARTLLCVPLRREGALLGMIASGRKEVRPFSDKEIALLENFAAQAVIAMENARLLNEQREALEQQTATAEVLQVINANPGNLAPVFEAILEKAHRICGATIGSLIQYDGECLRATATHGFTEEFAAFLRQPFRPSGRYQRLIDGERFVQAMPGDAMSLRQAEVAGVRTTLAVPLRKDTVFLGAITAHRTEVRPFGEREIVLLENFASQAVIAMENARLLDEIRQRQAELRVTFDNMGDGVVMFDAEHRLAAWNRNFQELLDLPDAALAKRPSYADYLRLLAERGEFGAEDVEAELTSRLGNTDRELRLERTRPDGRVIELRRNPVPDGGFVLIYSDISERKRSEAEIRAARDAAEAAYRDLKAAQANLIQAEKMASLGQLTAGIAHEIKNPLNFVNNFAELSVDLLGELKDAIAPAEPALTEKQRAEVEEVSVMLTSNLEKIAEHGRRADSIVKNMLLHSRTGPSEHRAIDVNTTVEEALNLAYHGARAETLGFNITMEKDLDPKAGSIHAFPQEFLRVMLNLISNGFYAARKRANAIEDRSFEPMLHVSTRNLGSQVEIRVRDNGTGIGDEARDKIFEPFFTTKPAGEGTGLGLSLSYDIIVKQHGGQLTVDSRPNEFTEFQIILPRRMASNEGGRA